jgi:hypothetical protein
MNLEELLRESLREQSATPPENLSRRTELERRIGRRRWARVAGRSGLAAAVAAVVVVGTAAGVVALRPSSPAAHSVAAGGPKPSASPSPSPSPPPLPEYSRGYHRTTDQRITLPGQGSLTLHVTPTNLDFRIGINCSAVRGQLVALAVNGHTVGTIVCGPETNLPGPPPPPLQLAGPDFNAHYDSWSDVGVRVGKPATFTITVGAEVEGRDGQEPSVGAPGASGDVFAGVYLPVPFDQYPFPTRPATLADLDAQRLFMMPDFGDSLGQLDSRSLAAPNGSYSATLTMPKFLDLTVCSVAPGRVRMLVDGQPADNTAFWDWDGSCYLGDAFASDAPEPPSLNLKNIHSGQKVTVTIITSDFTVPGWRVGFDQSAN